MCWSSLLEKLQQKNNFYKLSLKQLDVLNMAFLRDLSSASFCFPHTCFFSNMFSSMSFFVVDISLGLPKADICSCASHYIAVFLELNPENLEFKDHTDYFSRVSQIISFRLLEIQKLDYIFFKFIFYFIVYLFMYFCIITSKQFPTLWTGLLAMDRKWFWFSNENKQISKFYKCTLTIKKIFIYAAKLESG